jgi:PAS domain S-box-containing protein
MSGALVVLSADRLITKINTQSEQLFGYDESELVGKEVGCLFGNDADSARISACLETLRQVKELECLEVCGAHRSGATFPAHFSGSAMYDDLGRLDGIICVFNDISAMKETESKLIQLAHHDPLTGLPNRNLFFDRLQQTLHTMVADMDVPLLYSTLIWIILNH